MSDLPKTDKRRDITDRIIADIENGCAPWQRPWVNGVPGTGRPFNLSTGKAYRGFNALSLSGSGYEDPRWMTFAQAKKMDASVAKGEKGHAVEFWQFQRAIDKLDDYGNPVVGENGKPVREMRRLRVPMVRYFTVFNAEQINGDLPALKVPERMWTAVDHAEQIVIGSGADIEHDGGDRAYYSILSDKIHMPSQAAFSDTTAYYGVLLHELAHWSGNKSRLNRKFGFVMGSPDYAREELCAEIASYFIGLETGIEPDHDRHASYIQSWVEILKNDKHEIFRAATLADQAANYILDFAPGYADRSIACEMPSTPKAELQEEDLMDEEDIIFGMGA